MKKISLFLSLLFSNSTYTSQKQSEPIPEPPLPIETIDKIFFEHIPQIFTPKTEPKEARDTIIVIRNVNKRLRNFITDPKTICTIINNIAQHRNQDVVAKEIGTKEALRYLKTQTNLCRHIYKMGPTKLANIFSKGIADATFLPHKKKPLLFSVKSNITKVKTLLQHGASPDTMFRGKTILKIALENDSNKLAKTVLAHNPKNKCLVETIQLRNYAILKKILKRDNVSGTELQEGLHCAIQEKDLSSITFLLAAGVDPKNHLYDAVSNTLGALFGFKRRDPEQLFEIVHLLCIYGAYDPNAHRLAHSTPNSIPQKLFDALETGRWIAQRKDLTSQQATSATLT